MFVVHTRNIAYEDFDPTVALAVALSTQNVSMRSSSVLLGLNYQERMPVFPFFIGFASICWPVLATNLRTSDSDGSKVLTPTLREKSGQRHPHRLRTRTRTLS